MYLQVDTCCFQLLSPPVNKYRHAHQGPWMSPSHFLARSSSACQPVSTGWAVASGHVFSSGISLSESLVRIGFGTTVLMNLGMELVPGWEEIGKAERVRIFFAPSYARVFGPRLCLAEVP